MAKKKKSKMSEKNAGPLTAVLGENTSAAHVASPSRLLSDKGHRQRGGLPAAAPGATSQPFLIYKLSLPLTVFDPTDSHGSAYGLFGSFAAEVLPGWTPTSWSAVEERLYSPPVGIDKALQAASKAAGDIADVMSHGDVCLVLPLVVQGFAEMGPAILSVPSLAGGTYTITDGGFLVLPAVAVPPAMFGTPGQPFKSPCVDGRRVTALLSYWTSPVRAETARTAPNNIPK